MGNSPLVKVTRISPNKNKRTQKIRKITPHHCAGVLTAEQILAIFAPTSRQASANYVIGNDGKIGLCVPENYRAWTSSSPANDQQAITIEVSNSATGGNWPVSSAAWNSLVELCVDICKRNGIKSLSWTGSSSGSLTCHYMFKSTNCPGAYMKGKMGLLASTVNARLSGTKTTTSSTKTITSSTTTKTKTNNTLPYLVKIVKTDTLNVRKGAGTSFGVATTVHRNEIYTIIEEKYNGSTKWLKLKSGAGWISANYTERYSSGKAAAAKTDTFKPYKVQVTASALNIRRGAGTNYATNGQIRDKGVYTIVEEKKNGSTTWGKLKSGAGWISLAYTKKV